MAAANKPEDGRSQDGDDSPAEPTVVCQQTAQRLVYEAARSTSDLRCGDHVEVEWEGTWYQGCISDVPTSETYAVVYETGDFEVAVPRSAVRLGPKKPRQPKKATGKASKNKRANLERLCNAANESDLETIMELLREGVSTTEEDELGYAAVHWVCGPDHDQPGDTITRRACVALVGRASGSLELKDGSALKMRPIFHSASLNLVGCVKTLAHLGASLSGALHWAVGHRAHACVRELLALGAPGGAKAGEWEGYTPLQLAVSLFDNYAAAILLEHAERRGGLRRMLGEAQVGGLKAGALHVAADKAADDCMALLLRYGADAAAHNPKGVTPLDLARKSAKSAPAATKEAAERCVDLLLTSLSERAAMARQRTSWTSSRTAGRELSNGTRGGTRGSKERARAATDGAESSDAESRHRRKRRSRRDSSGSEDARRDGRSSAGDARSRASTSERGGESQSESSADEQESADTGASSSQNGDGVGDDADHPAGNGVVRPADDSDSAGAGDGAGGVIAEDTVFADGHEPSEAANAISEHHATAMSDALGHDVQHHSDEDAEDGALLRQQCDSRLESVEVILPPDGALLPLLMDDSTGNDLASTDETFLSTVDLSLIDSKEIAVSGLSVDEPLDIADSLNIADAFN